MLHMAILLLCTNIAQAQEHGPVGAHRSNFDWQWKEVRLANHQCLYKYPEKKVFALACTTYELAWCAPLQVAACFPSAPFTTEDATVSRKANINHKQYIMDSSTKHKSL